MAAIMLLKPIFRESRLPNDVLVLQSLLQRTALGHCIREEVSGVF
jgi:hypothetical protein